jgi:hypothetical protein
MREVIGAVVAEKAKAEEHLRAAAIAWTIVRPGWLLDRRPPAESPGPGRHRRCSMTVRRRAALSQECGGAGANRSRAEKQARSPLLIKRSAERITKNSVRFRRGMHKKIKQGRSLAL